MEEKKLPYYQILLGACGCRLFAAAPSALHWWACVVRIILN
jgi:hypothetical protein